MGWALGQVGYEARKEAGHQEECARVVRVRSEVPTSGFFGTSVIFNAGLPGTQVRGCCDTADTWKGL